MIEDNGIRVQGRTLTIFCWGDEQRGSEGYRHECFQEMAHQFQVEPGGKLGLHMGDAWDWLRPVMRARVEGPRAASARARGLVPYGNERDRWSVPNVLDIQATARAWQP